MSNRLDAIKLNHWLNVRKMSLDVFNKLLTKNTNHKVFLNNLENLDTHTINEVEKILDVPKEFLLSHDDVPPYIYIQNIKLKKLNGQ